MALSQVEKELYEPLFSELKRHIKRPYVDEIVKSLENEGYTVNENAIHNVVRGVKKDFTILRALLKFFGIEEATVLREAGLIKASHFPLRKSTNR